MQTSLIIICILATSFISHCLLNQKLKKIIMTTEEEVTLLGGIADQLDAVNALVVALEAAPADTVPQSVVDALGVVKTKSDALTALIPEPPTA